MNALLVTALVLVLSVPALRGQDYERYRVLFSNDTFHSTHLNYHRNISVTVPLEFDSTTEARFPLIIVFDSQNARSHGFILRAIDYLTSNEQMPSSVVISVESTMETRYKETQLRVSDPAGLGESNSRFIIDELIPYARKRLSAGGHVTLIGHSRYGYFTTYMLMSHPEEISAVVALSPFFQQKNVNLVDSVPGFLRRIPSERQTYYRMAVGNDYPDDFKMMEKTFSATTMETRLDWAGELFPQADHNVVPGIAITTALYSIYEEWSRIQGVYMKDTTGGTSILHSLRGMVIDHYGEDIPFSLGVLNGKGWQYFNDGRYMDAITAWQAMTAAYPSFAEGHLYMAEAGLRIGLDVRPYLNRFKEGIVTSPFYNDDERAELMGEYEELLSRSESDVSNPHSK
jgi:predicted alpha/beta superfamily hydrolase